MQIGNINLGNKPVLLAPLEDISDSAFRLICKKHGADMVFTEFVASEALIRNVQKTIDKMVFIPEERPIGIQLFGNDVNTMAESAKIIAQFKPDTIDINFGCPVKKIALKGSGAALLKNIPLMVDITKAIVDAVNIPVTVKTRLGWDQTDKPIVEIVQRLQDVGVAAVTIHARTRSQMYSGLADWTLIGEIKNMQSIKIPIIGNGDVNSAEVAKLMFDRYGVDAIMIGRAAIGNPWIFSQVKEYLNKGIITDDVDLKTRIDTCLQHLKIAIDNKGETKAIIEMRRLYSGYFRNVYDFKKIRLKLLTAKSYAQVQDILLSAVSL
ncbi:MAG: tRNA dihydrouridine synthase DusB [Lentimicrobiaceae bacterium]|nr:tRNA dihydrouridine synthase DusB [Lentimicrobiaceae bacterium]